MQLLNSLLPLIVIFASAVIADEASLQALDALDGLTARGLQRLAKYEKKYKKNSTCTLATAVKRKEWSNLLPAERIAYTDAVLCLQSLPPKTPVSIAPGAKSRYDDFLVTHIQQGLTIHKTGNFLTWHRYFLWAYETALRDECGYKGYQPYWNWGHYSDDILNSAIFDGSDTSMGGNGAAFNYSGVRIALGVPPNDIIPPGVGGGCVTTGPFKNMSVNLGPIDPSIPGIQSNPQADGLGFNPRCLRRDVNPFAAALTHTNYTYHLITDPQNADIHWFQEVLQGNFSAGLLGVHAAGHYTIGGDPGGDFFVSPGDPVFFLHHAMVDRVWWLWQTRNLKERLTAVAGTLTLNNMPPSRNITLDDDVGLGLTAPDVKLRTLMDTMGGLDGKFCYVYV